MSAGPKLPLADASAAASRIVTLLRPACERIEIAGSIRRRASEVGDIEIVAVPRWENRPAPRLFETTWEPIDLLPGRLAELHAEGRLVPREVEVHRADGSVEVQRRVGLRYQALAFEGLFPVDLFIVRPPADWGVVFTIRTGPADWSARLVTDCQARFMRVEQGRLLHAGQHVPCPEEADFLAVIGQPWVRPEERSASRVALGGRA